MRVFLWIIKHPIEFYKIMTCFNHTPNLDTLKCARCGKQFRYVSAEEYTKKIKEII